MTGPAERSPSDDLLAPPGVRVVVLTRRGCHLCDIALQLVDEVVSETGDQVQVRDIDADPLLRERWSDQVPVTFVDGRQHDYWAVNPARLRAALTGA